MSYIDNSDTTVSNSYSFICTMSFKWTFWKVFLDYFDNSLKKSFSSLYFWLSFLWRYKVLWYFVQLYWIYFRLLRVLSQANISLYIKFFILGYPFFSYSFVNDFPSGNNCKLLSSRTGRIRWNLLPSRSLESFKELRHCLESRFPTTEGSISIPKCYVQTVLEGVPMPISWCSSSCRYTTKRF